MGILASIIPVHALNNMKFSLTVPMNNITIEMLSM